MRVDRLAQEYDVSVEWRAFELHPGIPPQGTPIPWPPERIAESRHRFARMADEAGLPHGERTHWYDSRPAHEASEWARERGADDPFRRAVFSAYFVDNQNIGSPQVLGRIAAELKLDGPDLEAALAEGRYRERVEKQYEQARESGITAVPAFVAGGYAMLGAQPYEVFQRFMEHVGGQRR